MAMPTVEDVVSIYLDYLLRPVQTHAQESMREG